MERVVKKCAGMDEKLAEMLFAPETVPAKVTTHVAACETCGKNLEELRATMGMLDAWQAPEPNPYFLTRLNARLDEERRAAPAGWFERLRARFTYGPRLHARPMAAMALTVVLLLGGGAYLGITNWDQPTAPAAPVAVVHDLQVLDNNAQLLDQLEALSTGDNGDNTEN